MYQVRDDRIGEKEMTVKEIVKNYLIANGFDGLYGDECGCETSDLVPCGGPCDECMAGYKLPCDCGGSCNWHIGNAEARDEAKKQAEEYAEEDTPVHPAAFNKHEMFSKNDTP